MSIPSHQAAARVLYPTGLLVRGLFYSTCVINLVIGILTLMGKLPPSVGATCLLLPLCVAVISEIIHRCLKHHSRAMCNFFSKLPHPTRPTAREITVIVRTNQIHYISTVALAIIALLVFKGTWNTEVLTKLASYSLIVGATLDLTLRVTRRLLCKNSCSAWEKFSALRNDPIPVP